MKNISQLIRQCLSAWETDDEALLQTLIADDFTFTSPNDDHLNRTQYWEVCWSHSNQIKSYRILSLFAEGDAAFVRYEATLKDGSRIQNTEFIRSDGEKITGVEVYFGRKLE